MQRRLGNVSLEFLDQLLEGLTDVPYFVKDASLRYVAANPAMARLCGLRRPSQMYGRRASDFFSPELVARYEAFDQQVMTTGRPISNRFDLTQGAGARPVWLLFTRVPVRGERGKVVGVAASAKRFRSAGRSDPVFNRIARVSRRIESGFGEALKLPELAEMAGVSVSQLERDFASLFGATPHAMLNKARINHALKLLDTEMTISSIAQECGFTDHSAFTRSFREAVGVSPRAYRTLLRAGSRDEENLGGG